ncbi:MAG TPA: non-canonical purine NTP pyrophosphatase [Candidatus Binataceae bacterium]|nr:non-canonical purine NTP pyrophosphatase [Candidatus Binataceae bacterium]
MPNALLIATTNPAKLAEYRLLLRGLAIEPVALADVRIDDAPAESCETFADNALIKARFYFERCGLPTLADDGGLEVDALGGAPGVRSHRWLGDDAADDRALAAEVIRRMHEVPWDRRTARLKAAAALVWRAGSELRERIVEAALEGLIAERVYDRIQPGFPYRAVLLMRDSGKYLAELSEEAAAALSQRRALVEQLYPELAALAVASP